jgi:hypothetical protein
VPRKEREKELGEKAKKFTNVYIKNFGEDLGEDKLKEIFSKFGKITSYKVVSKVLLLRQSVSQYLKIRLLESFSIKKKSIYYSFLYLRSLFQAGTADKQCYLFEGILLN